MVLKNKLWCLFLILSIAKVSHGQLMCYVCENCAQVSVDTPQFECNADFFNTGGATDSSIQTTTELPKTSPGITEDNGSTTKEETTATTLTTEEETSTITTETTTELVTETTTELTTESTSVEIVETTHGPTTSTEAQPPTPPTVGPPMTTTAIPTPPNPGTVKPLDDDVSLNNQSFAHEQRVNKDEVEDVEIEHAAATTTKTYKPSAEFRVRQLRSVSDVTYHCYKVHATTANGTMVVNRGCSRVQTMESVCGQWESQHPNEQMNKCYPCSRTKCNGSSALSVSFAALIVAMVAVFIHRK